MRNDEDENKPKLESVDGGVIDFKKKAAEKEKEGGELKTKFDFKHDGVILNFHFRPCEGDDYHIMVTTDREMQTPFGTVKATVLVEDEHVDPSIFQKIKKFFGKKINLEQRVEQKAWKLQEEIKGKIKRIEETEALQEKFSL